MAQLEMRAQKATQGIWYATNDNKSAPIVNCVVIDRYETRIANFPYDPRGDVNSTYVASASPATVLSLIARIRELENRVKELEEEANWLATTCKRFCENHHYCNECVLYPADCPGILDIENRFEKYVVADFRKAAGEAVKKDGTMYTL